MKRSLKETVLKVVSSVLIYTLLLQEFIPCVRAMNHIDSTLNMYHGTRENNPSEQWNQNLLSLNSNGIHEDYNYEGNHIKSGGSSELSTVDIDGFEKLSTVSVASGGPGQSETSGYSVNSTSDLVDKFTGDFSYSIPLLDVEGYPITISYNSNVTMNSEASWVGLGWDLNVGSVSREMRGIPDEFNGEQNVVRTFNQKVDNTSGDKYGGFIGAGIKINKVFIPSVQLTLLKGTYDNSYLGFGKTFDIGLQAKYSVDDRFYVGPTFGIGYSSDSKNGKGTSKNIGIAAGTGGGKDRMVQGSISVGSSFNSRRGITSKSINLDASFIPKDFPRVMVSYGTGTALSYGTITSVPTIPFRSIVGGTQTNTTLSISNEFASWIGSTGLVIQESSVTNTIELNSSNQIVQPAIGYFHSGKREQFHDGNLSYPIMDFNRSPQQEYSEEMSNLDFSIQTYDIFRVNASGLSATFRGRRTDFGTYYDASNDTKTLIHSHNPSAGVTVDLPNVKLSAGYAYSANSGGVETDNFRLSGDNLLEFDTEGKADSFDNNVYFKGLGEPTPEDMDAYSYMGGEEGAYFDFDHQTDKKITLTNTLKYGASSTTMSSSTLNNYTNEVTRANQYIPLTVADMASPFNYFKNYNLNDFDATNSAVVYRSDEHREDNHLSAIKIVDNNGTKYTYGLPAYNINESTVSFAVEGRSVETSSGLVTYLTGDNSTANSLGRSKYYDKTTIPAYAHSFLLTEMLSSDYIDRYSDGPTLDDIGTWYKFNYTQVYGAESDSVYRWRYPVAGGSTGKEALYNKGVLGSTQDDIGSYSYGEKEIWYVHSIETKNYIAEFYLEDRYDAYGVKGEDGILNDTPLKKLTKIVLYNRADRVDNDTSAVPIQTIEFEYDYSLCKKSPSNKYSYTPTYIDSLSGKLTLKKIRVYKGSTSEEMALSNYEFYYGEDDASNKDFNYGDVDAWGNYKNNVSNSPNDIFPYASQTAQGASDEALAWKLKNIKTPLGGEIDITYESDSYGYVQNKRAMRHFKVKGMTNLIRFLDIIDQGNFSATTQLTSDFTESMSSSTISSIAGSPFKDLLTNWPQSDMPYTAQFGDFDTSFIPNNVIVFELEDEISSSLSWQQATDSVRRAYFQSNGNNANSAIKQLYLKIHMNVESGVDDYIPYFADISDDFINPFNNSTISEFDDDFQAIGVMPPNGMEDYKYGYVVINPIETKEKLKGYTKKYAAQPMQLAAVEFARTNLQDKIYGACATCTPENDIDNEVILGKNVNWVMIEQGYADNLYNVMSTLRLYEPDGEKFGGGARVKQIIYSDNWDVISGEYASTYTWKYDYSGGNTHSGVASWEPRGMRDENPLYQWDTYLNSNDGFPAEHKFTPTPIGDLLFPIPVVGYSRVEVRFEGSYDKGYSVSEFYTSKDYPTIEKNTDIQKIDKVDQEKSVKGVLTGSSKKLFGYSQGFSIITNDFHGKPKSQSLYNKIGDVQSKTTYTYYGLSDKLKMIDRDGDLSEQRVGLEYDIHADSRLILEKNLFNMIGLDASWTVAPIPSPIPVIMPMIFTSTREQGFYSHALVKHINKSAIVKEIQTIYMQSTNYAENLAYDYNSGNVLVSSLTDEYDDKLYSFSYPAHWYYDQFRDRSSVEGLVTTGSISGQQLTTTVNLTENFVAGDYIKITSGAYTDYAYILYINGSTAYLITTTGNVYNNLSGSVTVTLLNSGRENRLMESMQSMVTKKAPSLSVGAFAFPQDEVISTSVITYRDRNNVKCRTGSYGEGASNELVTGQYANPYTYGIKGKLVPDGQFAWKSPRVNATHAHGVRFDGWIDTLIPFYKLNTTDDEWYAINESSHPNNVTADPYQKWRKLGQTTLFDEYGKPLESEDQIDVRSAVLYGYNNELVYVPIAQAVNARKQDIAFDGFEDYTYYTNNPLASIYETHFDYKDALTTGVSVTQSERHSGLSSLDLGGQKSAEVTKKIGYECVNPGDGMTDSLFYADSCLCIPPFEPLPGKYILRAWVKVSGHSPSSTTYTEGKIDVNVSGTVNTFSSSGPIIDGWQRIEGIFEIPDTATTIKVKLYNTDLLKHVYFDDLRIHPFLAGMSTVVYDPQTLLPLATHDGYNFTTYYNYDENLNQVRVRVETIEGIKTIMESEFGGKKSFDQP